MGWVAGALGSNVLQGLYVGAFLVATLLSIGSLARIRQVTDPDTRRGLAALLELGEDPEDIVLPDDREELGLEVPDE